MFKEGCKIIKIKIFERVPEFILALSVQKPRIDNVCIQFHTKFEKYMPKTNRNIKIPENDGELP